MTTRRLVETIVAATVNLRRVVAKAVAATPFPGYGTPPVDSAALSAFPRWVSYPGTILEPSSRPATTTWFRNAPVASLLTVTPTR